MKGKIYKKGLAVLLGLTLAANLPVTSPLSIHMLDSYAYTGAATVKASSLNVRCRNRLQCSGPSGSRSQHPDHRRKKGN